MAPGDGGATTALGRASRWQAAGRALRHRNFQLFFSGQLISLVGTWMQTVAQSWLVYRLTGSGLKQGAVGFASQIPVFLFADRKSTRLNSSHGYISYAVFCLKKKKKRKS